MGRCRKLGEMRRSLDWALDDHVLVWIELGDEGIPVSNLAERRVGAEAPAALKGFNHASDTAVLVSLVGLDIVWTRIIDICGIVKGFEGAGGGVGHVCEEIVIGTGLRGRTPDFALEDVATEIARRCEEGILPKSVHSHSAKERLEGGVNLGKGCAEDEQVEILFT